MAADAICSERDPVAKDTETAALVSVSPNDPDPEERDADDPVRTSVDTSEPLPPD